MSLTVVMAREPLPPDCPAPERNRYLAWVAHRHGAPVRETLPDTVTAALALARVALTTR
jgi:hypothetical protein